MFKVLIVDDEPSVLRMLKQMVPWKEHGFEVCGESCDGENAVQKIRELEPHLVITDIRMPVLDGLEVIKMCQEDMEISPKFVIISGHDDFKYAKTAMKYNVRNYLLKPIDLKELENELEKIQKELKAEEYLKKQYDLDKKMIRKNRLKRLVNGDFNFEIQKEISLQMGLDSDKEESFYLVLLCLNDNLKQEDVSSNVDEIQLQSAFIDILENYIEFDLNKFVFIDESYRFGFLLPVSFIESVSYDINKFIIKFSKELVLKNNLSISIFISDRGETLNSVAELYKQALYASNFRFFKGKNAVVFFEDIKSKVFSYHFNDITQPHNVAEFIRTSRKDDLKTELSHIFRIFLEKLIAKDIIDAYIKNLGFCVIKVLSEYNCNIEEHISQYSIFNYSMEKLTLAQLEAQTLDFCLHSIEILENAEKIKSVDFIILIKEYVDKNFTANISLKSIAKEYYINPVYLGQLFKNNFGEYFIDYLQKMRILEAKRLLENTNMKVEAIAKEVGYKDKNYFVAIFTDRVKMTPSQFRYSLKEDK